MKRYRSYVLLLALNSTLGLCDVGLELKLYSGLTREVRVGGDESNPNRKDRLFP